MHAHLPSLLDSIRNLFPQLPPEDQRELYNTICQLKIDAAQREAEQVTDPEMRMFALGFVQLERETLHTRLAREAAQKLLTAPKPDHEKA
jgi:hypothetical protein